jgi:Flp pilus assembly protein TadD
MASPRAESLRALLRKRPDDPRLLFGLALEHLNAGDLEDGVRELHRYLEIADDEGNAWGRLGAALRELGRGEEARDAYERGAAAAEQHGHPTMAEEFREILEAW